ncbi:MAG: phosphatase PAP2 family protein [Candidatus Neomarinimicrobiota bacterium]
MKFICRLTIFLIWILPLSLTARTAIEFDTGWSARLQGSNHHPLVDYFWEAISLGSPLVEAGGVLGSGLNGNPTACRTSATTLLLTQIVTMCFKYLIRRPRPERTYQPRLWNTRITPSFPSGHTASSAAFATSAGLQFPEYQPLLVGFALLSGFSQIYVGNHYCGDVLAGLAVGSLVGGLVYAGWHGGDTAPAPDQILRIRLNYIF